MLRTRIIAMGKSAVYDQCIVKGGLYSLHTGRDQIEAYQLQRFNEIWRDACANVPLYTRLKDRHGLPERIESLAELAEWPILTRSDMRDADDLLVRKDSPQEAASMTGGSTGEPMRFGLFKSQSIDVAANMWIGRARYGVLPGMKHFMLWGHSHLLGKGAGRIVKKFARKARDRVMGYLRCNAYDLSPRQLRMYYDKLTRFRPEALIGYSAATLAFCRANSDRIDDARQLGLRCALCTAGPLTTDERTEIGKFFNAPLCMEYGAVETGVMAYTRPDTEMYSVFWDTHLLQAVGQDDGPPKVIVTCLTRSYLPIVRYDVGDLMEIDGDAPHSVLGFRAIIGRPDDTITLAGGASFHSVLLTHVIMKCSKVLASQAVVTPDKITLKLIVSEKLSEQDKNDIRQRAFKQVPQLSNTEIEVQEVSELIKSPSGKVRLVIRENESVASNVGMETATTRVLRAGSAGD